MEESEMSLSERIKKDFNTAAIVLIPIAIGMNIVGQFFVQSLRLPLWQNTTGTMLVGVLCGPWVAAATGLLSNTVAAFTIEGPTSLAFAHVNAVYGIVAALLADRGWFRKIWTAYLSGFVGEIVSIPFGTPVALYLFGGITAGGGSMITALLMGTGRSVVQSMITGSLFIDGLIDKGGSAVIAYLIIRALPKRNLYRFTRAPWTVLGEKVSEETSV
jgi:energy-coupling factor transport system substrate-specific component